MTLPSPIPRRINIRNPKWDGVKYLYIGRPAVQQPFHFGNPFSHKHGTKASIIVASQEMAVREYEAWLRGTKWKRLEQDRRFWILDHLDKLDDRPLGCFCDENTRWCHGEVLLKLRKEQVVHAAQQTKEKSSRRPVHHRQLSLRFPKGTSFEINRREEK